VLTAPWTLLSGGLVIPFDLLGDPNAFALLPPTPPHSFDVIVAAAAQDDFGSQCYIFVQSPEGVHAQVSIEGPPAAAGPVHFRAVLVRELVVPAGYALGAAVPGAPFAFQLRLAGYLLRFTLR